MSEYVIFTKYGLISYEYEEDEKFLIPQYVDDPMPFLRKECRIEAGTTLRNIMDYVRTNSELEKFISCYSGVPEIRQWHSQLDDKESEDAQDHDTVLHKLFISRVAEVHEENMEWWLNFTAIGDPTEYDKENFPEVFECYFSVSGQHLNHIADLPIFLDDKVEMIDCRDYQKKLDEDHEQEEKYELPILFRVEHYFSLLDVLDAIYWDISFYGPPSEAKEFFTELHSRVDSIKENLEDCDCRPVEEVFNEIEEKFKEEHKGEECPHCCVYHGYEIKNFDPRNNTGDICCSGCGKKVKEWMK